MQNQIDIREALKKTWDMDNKQQNTSLIPIKGQDKEVSLLIHDIFGGEILKTSGKKGWHFYNRIDGERMDFTGSEADNQPKEFSFEDIPSTPEETYPFIETADYSQFYTKFIKAFEEIIGLRYFHQEYIA
jgi:hypothetical protein